jgi:hypothetical protein
LFFIVTLNLTVQCTLCMKRGHINSACASTAFDKKSSSAYSVVSRTILDSGASTDVRNRADGVDLAPSSSTIVQGVSGPISASTGTMVFKSGTHDFPPARVHILPSSPANLKAVGPLLRQGYRISLALHGSIAGYLYPPGSGPAIPLLLQDDVVCLPPPSSSQTLALSATALPSENPQPVFTVSSSLAHKLLGHRDKKITRHMAAKVRGLILSDPDTPLGPCYACDSGKFTAKRRGSSSTASSFPRYTLNTVDMLGQRVRSLQGNITAHVFGDPSSGMRLPVPVRDFSANEALRALNVWLVFRFGSSTPPKGLSLLPDDASCYTASLFTSYVKDSLGWSIRAE